MYKGNLPDNFYDGIKTRLYKRIGRELRLARRVLDIGCGSCDLVKHLANAYCQEVTGVDISSVNFPTSPRSPKGIRFRCFQRDAAEMEFVADQSVDAIVMVWAMHEMVRPQAVLEETRRVLRPGGEILIVDFPKDSLAQKLWNENYYRQDEVKRLLQEAAFQNVQVRLVQKKQVIWARGYRPPAIKL